MLGCCPDCNRCHSDVGGCKGAKCANGETPDALPNPHKFPTDVVKFAQGLLNKWFKYPHEDGEESLGMCRVTEMGGFKNSKGTYEPVMFYDYYDNKGEKDHQFSGLAEVAKWVKADATNLV